MKKFIFTLSVDILFLSFSIFLLSFVILRIYLPFTPSLLFSVSISTVSSIFATKINVDKIKKSEAIRLDGEIAENVLNQLCLNGLSENTRLTENAVKNLGYNYVKRENRLLLTDKKALIYLAFYFDGLKKSDVIRAFNRIEKDEEVYILTAKATDDVLSFAEKFGNSVRVMQGKSVYRFYKRGSSLPEITVVLKKPKPKFKDTLKSLFKKRKATRYFLFGISLLFLSFITPLKIYYITFGGILLTLSLLCRFFGKKEIKEDEEL